MIDWIDTPHGRLPRRKGLQLCSKRDPVKEAKAWVEGLRGQGFDLSQETHAVVVGGGAGFHVIELQRAYPKLSILVIETNAELAEQAKEDSQGNFQTRWITVSQEEAEAVLTREIEGEFISARVLSFHPSWQARLEEFSGFRKKIHQMQWDLRIAERKKETGEIVRILRSIVKCD